MIDATIDERRTSDDLDRQKRSPVPDGVIGPLRDRWSPRAFDPTPVPEDVLRTLFEAARWAPSSGNHQPWRFLVVDRRDAVAHDEALACLKPKNADWAKRAPLLVFTFVERAYSSKRGATRANRAAEHDLGLAVANLTAQATAHGLSVHQMGGVDLEAIRRTYEVPEGFDPFTAVAIGRRGSPEVLPDDLQVKEARTRTRRPLEETVFRGRFGRPDASLTGAESGDAEPG